MWFPQKYRVKVFFDCRFASETEICIFIFYFFAINNKNEHLTFLPDARDFLLPQNTPQILCLTNYHPCVICCFLHGRHKRWASIQPFIRLTDCWCCLTYYKIQLSLWLTHERMLFGGGFNCHSYLLLSPAGFQPDTVHARWAEKRGCHSDIRLSVMTRLHL